MEEVILKIVTPKVSYGPYECDSIHLTVCDNESMQGGGSYGIRKGHAKALMVLECGNIRVFRDGQLLIEGKSGCGFATVENNQVTAVVESFVM